MLLLTLGLVENYYLVIFYLWKFHPAREDFCLLSKGIDTLAHSWPRGELLLAAFSTSVIYPRGVASKDLQNGHLTYNFRYF